MLKLSCPVSTLLPETEFIGLFLLRKGMDQRVELYLFITYLQSSVSSSEHRKGGKTQIVGGKSKNKLGS